MTNMQIGFIPFKLSTANLTERYAATMIGVDIGCNLKDKAGEFLLRRIYTPFKGLRRARRGSNFHKAIEQFFHAKVIQGRTKEYGSYITRKVSLDGELRINAINEFQIITQLPGIFLTDTFIKFLRMNIDFNLFGDMLFVGSEQIQITLIDIVDSFESGALINGPAQRAHSNLRR